MRVIGLMSGTSADGIDAALVEVSGRDADLRVRLQAAETYPYPADLQAEILAACAGEPRSAEAWAALDDAIARAFADAAIALQQGFAPADLIGSHGQTVFHRPPEGDRLGYSWQLGRGSALAAATGLPVVSNFRAADLAAGGQGAPLVSRLDAYLLGDVRESRCVQNLGGIGNVTYLPARAIAVRSGGGARDRDETGDRDAALAAWEAAVRGWDTGPANLLIDLAVRALTGDRETFDRDGARAAAGTPCLELVDRWLQQPFFRAPPPKSTGRERFGPAYLARCRADAAPFALSDADWLATLTELTAASVADSYRAHLPALPDRVLLCGGGSRNGYLRSRLAARLDPIPVQTTAEFGLDPGAKEAIAFAVLAYWRQSGLPGNLPSVTGAARALPLGELWTIA